MPDVLEAWRRSLTCEIAWTVTKERPAVVAAVPLVLDGLPCVALPYSFAERVASVRDAEEVAFVLSDAGNDARGLSVTGPCAVVDDVLGERFSQELLKQEVVKYPPSRVYVDTPLLRRENWWWLPRIIVQLRRIDRHRALPVRNDPARDALLVRHDGYQLRLDVVSPAAPTDWSANRMQLRSPEGALRGDGARVVAFWHQYTVPDLERWESWQVRGVLRGDELEVTGREGSPHDTLAPLGLLQRIRRQRNLERDCKRSIAAAERRIGPAPS